MKTDIHFLQFYINNTCNLACPGCLSYNNFAFKGKFDWSKNKPFASEWSNKLNPEEVSILGGEPFSHPNLDDWVYGLKELFPKCADFRIVTNGTFLNSKLDKILEYTHAGVNIEVSSHSVEHFNQHLDFAKTHFAVHVSTEYEEVCNGYNHRFTNGNGWIEIRSAYNFFTNSIKEIKNGIVYMHSSDPAIAHQNCPIYNCHYVVEGRLYKCVVTATSHLFEKQFSLDEHSKELISQINSVSPFDTDTVINSFLTNIDKPCAQCALCPQLITVTQFELPSKKPQISIKPVA